MLYRMKDGDLVPWRGEPVNGKKYPLNIEHMKSTEELRVIGLYKAPPDPVPPEGEEIVSKILTINGGEPQWLYTTRPIHVDPWDVAEELRSRAEFIVPYQKQIDMVSRKGELELKAAQTGLTAEEQGELDGINTTMAAIRKLSEAADRLISMNPIPWDYQNDRYWE